MCRTLAPVSFTVCVVQLCHFWSPNHLVMLHDFSLSRKHRGAALFCIKIEEKQFQVTLRLMTSCVGPPSPKLLNKSSGQGIQHKSNYSLTNLFQKKNYSLTKQPSKLCPRAINLSRAACACSTSPHSETTPSWLWNTWVGAQIDSLPRTSSYRRRQHCHLTHPLHKPNLPSLGGWHLSQALAYNE